jgi:hypothetical protein
MCFLLVKLSSALSNLALLVIVYVSSRVIKMRKIKFLVYF